MKSTRCRFVRDFINFWFFDVSFGHLGSVETQPNPTHYVLGLFVHLDCFFLFLLGVANMNMTLEKFIAEMGKRPWSLYVEFPGFSSLYVRRGPCFLNCGYLDGVVTIANATAEQPGKGSFSRLVNFIQSKGLSIYAENVLAENFIPKLERMGFKKVVDKCPSCYFLERSKDE